MTNKTQWLTSTDYFEGLLYDGADARALILDMLSNRSPCSKLARNVTSFFGEDLRLSTYPDAAYSSVYTYTVDDKVHIRLGLASDRVMESLVHELLHLELLREGFPRLDIHDTPQNRDAFHSHYGLFNYLQHEVMYPTYVSLGLGSSRFLAPSDALSTCEMESYLLDPRRDLSFWARQWLYDHQTARMSGDSRPIRWCLEDWSAVSTNYPGLKRRISRADALANSSVLSDTGSFVKTFDTLCATLEMASTEPGHWFRLCAGESKPIREQFYA